MNTVSVREFVRDVSHEVPLFTAYWAQFVDVPAGGGPTHFMAINLMGGVAPPRTCADLPPAMRAIMAMVHEATHVGRGCPAGITLPKAPAKRAKAGAKAGADAAPADADEAAELDSGVDLASGDDSDVDADDDAAPRVPARMGGTVRIAKLQRFDEDLLDDDGAYVGTRVWLLERSEIAGESLSAVADRIIAGNAAFCKRAANTKRYRASANTGANMAAAPAHEAHRGIVTPSEWVTGVLGDVDTDYVREHEAWIAATNTLATADSPFAFERMFDARRALAATPAAVCDEQRRADVYFAARDGGAAVFNFPMPNRVTEVSAEHVPLPSLCHLPMPGRVREAIVNSLLYNARVLSRTFDLETDGAARMSFLADAVHAHHIAHLAATVRMGPKARPYTELRVALPAAWRRVVVQAAPPPPPPMADDAFLGDDDLLFDAVMAAPRDPFAGDDADDAEAAADSAAAMPDDDVVRLCSMSNLAKRVDPNYGRAFTMDEADETAELVRLLNLGVHPVDGVPADMRSNEIVGSVPEIPERFKNKDAIFEDRSVLLRLRRINKAAYLQLVDEWQDDPAELQKRAAEFRSEATREAYVKFMTDEHVDQSHLGVRKTLYERSHAGTLWGPPEMRHYYNRGLTLFGNMIVGLHTQIHDLYNTAEYRHGNVMRVFWVHFTALRYSWDLFPNMLLTGSAASGKSYTFSLVQSLSHEDLMQMGTHETRMVYTAHQDSNYVALWYDEIPLPFLGMGPDGSKGVEDSILKSRLTSLFTVSRRFHRDETTGQSVVIVEVCRCMGTVMGCNNHYVPESSTPMQTRFMHMFSYVVRGSQIGEPQSTTHQGAAPYFKAKHASEFAQREVAHHCLVALTERMIEAHAIADVGTLAYRAIVYIFETYLGDMYNMRDHMTERNRSMVMNIARSITIYYAWYVGVFGELGVKWRINSDGTPRKLGPEHVSEAVQPRLWITHEISVYVLTLFQELWISNVDIALFAAVAAHFKYTPGRPGTMSVDPSLYARKVNHQPRNRPPHTRPGQRGGGAAVGMDNPSVQEAENIENTDFRYFRYPGDIKAVSSQLHDSVNQIRGGGYSPEAMAKVITKWNHASWIADIPDIVPHTEVGDVITGFDRPPNQTTRDYPVKIISEGGASNRQSSVCFAVSLLDRNFDEACTSAVRFLDNAYSLNRARLVTGLPMVVPAVRMGTRDVNGADEAIHIAQLITTRWPRTVTTHSPADRRHVIRNIQSMMTVNPLNNAATNNLSPGFREGANYFRLTTDYDHLGCMDFFMRDLHYAPQSTEWRSVLPSTDLASVKRIIRREAQLGANRTIFDYPADYYKVIYNEYCAYRRACAHQKHNINTMKRDARDDVRDDRIAAEVDALASSLSHVDLAEEDMPWARDNAIEMQADHLPLMSTTEQLVFRHIAPQGADKRPPPVDIGDLERPRFRVPPTVRRPQQQQPAAIDDPAPDDFDDIDNNMPI